jgi:DNA-binding GntR family transcriptional regulator
MPTPSILAADKLVKHTLAERLRREIVMGALAPGARIVEGKGAQKFGVAQGSIREAINILAQDGFVTKESGRSARVIHLSEKDVAQLYELRGALEGLAARLAAAMQPECVGLQTAVDGMRRAADAGDADSLLDCDLRFHLELCELSGSPYVIEHGRKILLPFFAFVRMRVIATGQKTGAWWDRDLESHQRIIDLLREGEGEVAEQYVKRAMDRFSKTAYDNWERRVSNTKDRRPIKRRPWQSIRSNPSLHRTRDSPSLPAPEQTQFTPIPTIAWQSRSLGASTVSAAQESRSPLALETDLFCDAIDLLARPLAGMAIEDLMGDFGRISRELADDPSLRWLGPHKGVVHLALASITNACFDLWAKSRGVPLWKLLLDLKPEEVVRLLDLSYLEDML